MIFQNEKVSLYLEVVKYQFENANIACDRNWLIVKVKLLEVNKVYNTMDPFFKNIRFTTHEELVSIITKPSI